MYNNVDWNIDFVRYLPMMKAEYNKCNIWPKFVDDREFEDVLIEEAKETRKCALDLFNSCDAIMNYAENELISYDRMVEYTKGQAMKTIFEALHTLAVCKKWEYQNILVRLT